MAFSKKQTNKYKEKFVILRSIGIIVINSKETREFTYTCRYSSGHLILILIILNIDFLNTVDNAIKIIQNLYEKCAFSLTQSHMMITKVEPTNIGSNLSSKY